MAIANGLMIKQSLGTQLLLPYMTWLDTDTGRSKSSEFIDIILL